MDLKIFFRDQNVDIMNEFLYKGEFQSIPTLVLLDHGKVVDKQVGALPERRLRSWLESKLPKGP